MLLKWQRLHSILLQYETNMVADSVILHFVLCWFECIQIGEELKEASAIPGREARRRRNSLFIFYKWVVVSQSPLFIYNESFALFKLLEWINLISEKSINHNKERRHTIFNMKNHEW